jgi:DinB superfamily
MLAAEFKGNVMTQTELQNLIASLAETPTIVRQLIGELSTDEARWRPAANEFSALEQACHLRDIEREAYAVRLRRLLDEDEPVLADVNGARLAQERAYQSQDLAAALEAFAQARRESMATVEKLSLDELQRSGTLEGVGRVTVAQLFELMRAHDAEHCAELRALCAGLNARRN